MSDLVFVSGALALLFLLGYPMVLLFPADAVGGRALGAPVLGYGLFGVLVTILYRYGFSPQQSLRFVLALVGCVLVGGVLGAWVIRRRLPGPAMERRLFNSDAMVFGIAAGLVILLCLLPKWIGGTQFAVFQGNHWDQINYIAYSSVFRDHSFSEVHALTPATALDNNYLFFAQSQLDARPTVGLAYVTLGILFGLTTPDGSYAYMAFMQILMLFSATVVLLNLFDAGGLVTAVLAAALTLGFFMQYVLDINAWSQLAAMPLALLAVGVMILTVDRPVDGPAIHWWKGVRLCGRYVVLLALVLAAVFYFYPESALEYGVVLAIVPICAVVSSRFSRFALVRLIGVGVAGALALAACIPFWDGTIGHVIRQLSLASDTSIDWSRYFQRYLLGRDIDGLAALGGFRWSIDSVYAICSLPVDFVVSAIGLYYVLPTRDVPLAARIGWKAVLLALAAILLAGAARSVLGAWRRDINSRSSRLFIGAAVACIPPVLVFVAGRYWSAGKALAMASPLLFMILVSPLLTGRRGRWSVVAWGLVAGHLAFGVYRPIAAANPDGVHYDFPPYPSAQDSRFKRELSWDLPAWKSVLAACRRTSIDLENPFLERYVQVYLTELGVDWSSVHPLDSYYGYGTRLGMQPQLEAPDCLVTSQLDRVRAGQTVIWLGRDHRPWDFFRGADRGFEIGVTVSSVVTASGVHGLETRGGGTGDRLRWTDGKATIEVPINAQNPPDRLYLGLWGGLRPAGRGHLQVLANGVSLFDGHIPDGEWSAGFPLDELKGASKLIVQINSDVFSPPKDGRVLGVPLRYVTLVRGADPSSR